MAGLCHVLALRTRNDDAEAEAAEREKETTAPRERLLMVECC